MCSDIRRRDALSDCASASDAFLLERQLSSSATRAFGLRGVSAAAGIACTRARGPPHLIAVPEWPSVCEMLKLPRPLERLRHLNSACSSSYLVVVGSRDL